MFELLPRRRRRTLSTMPLVAHARIARTGAVAVVAAIAVSVGLSALGEPWRTGAAAAIAVALIALGSPHGALDHVALMPKTAPDAFTRSAMRGLNVRFVIGYVSLALAALGAYLFAPRLGFALFLLLSIGHFAAGEAGVALERRLGRNWSDPLVWVASLGGGLIVLLPLASREAGVALSAVDPRLAPVLTPLPMIADVVTVLAVLATAGCVVAAIRGHHAAGTVALDLGALTALAVLAHPLIAFATFFAFWHALRHQARLAQVLRGPDDTPLERHAGRPLLEVLDSARPGLPATVGVLLVAVGLAISGATLLGGLLAVIWALTVPHSVAVAVLEVRSARARRHATTVPHDGTVAGRATSNRHDNDDPPVPAMGPTALPAATAGRFDRLRN